MNEILLYISIGIGIFTLFSIVGGFVALFYRTRGEIDQKFGKVDLSLTAINGNLEKTRLSFEKDIALLNLNLEERHEDYKEVKAELKDHEERLRKLENKK